MDALAADPYALAYGALAKPLFCKLDNALPALPPESEAGLVGYWHGNPYKGCAIMSSSPFSLRTAS